MGATERTAYTRAQLERLIAPQSIAIVGASPRAGSFGMRTLENLAQYKGEVLLVNAKYERIGERACHASLKALPRPPDCAVLVVPREVVAPTLEEAAAAGVGSVIVYASGYGEMDRAGSAGAQRRLAAIARAAQMPMLGPNCMGLVNHALGAGMTFIPEYARAPRNPGSIAVVSQSGALGYTLVQAWDRGVGIRCLVLSPLAQLRVLGSPLFGQFDLISNLRILCWTEPFLNAAPRLRNPRLGGYGRRVGTRTADLCRVNLGQVIYLVDSSSFSLHRV